MTIFEPSVKVLLIMIDKELNVKIYAEKNIQPRKTIRQKYEESISITYCFFLYLKLQLNN